MRRLRKPCRITPISSCQWRTGWWSPAVTLNGSPARQQATMNPATSAGSGKASAVAPPVRSLAPTGRRRRWRSLARAAMASSIPGPRATSRKGTTSAETEPAASSTGATKASTSTAERPSDASTGSRASTRSTEAPGVMVRSNPAAAMASPPAVPSKTTLTRHGPSPVGMEAVRAPARSSSRDAGHRKRPSIHPCSSAPGVAVLADGVGHPQRCRREQPGVVDQRLEQRPPPVDQEGHRPPNQVQA